MAGSDDTLEPGKPVIMTSVRRDEAAGISLAGSAEALYAVQDYSARPTIQGVERIPLRRFVDDGGSFFEMGRLTEEGALQGVPEFRVRQISYSEVLPGTVKAFHIHRLQGDIWFVPPSSRLLVGLYDARQGSATQEVVMRFVLGDGQPFALYIPPGVAHGCANIWTAPAQVIYLANRQFSAGPDTDEGRLPWDLLGTDFWELQRG